VVVTETFRRRIVPDANPRDDESDDRFSERPRFVSFGVGERTKPNAGDGIGLRRVCVCGAKTTTGPRKQPVGLNDEWQTSSVMYTHGRK